MTTETENQMTREVLDAIKPTGQHPIGALMLLADYLAGHPEYATTTVAFTPGHIEVTTVESNPYAMTQWSGTR